LGEEAISQFINVMENICQVGNARSQKNFEIVGIMR
jgi:hypothetical protein